MKKRWFILGMLALMMIAMVVPQVSADGPADRTERAEVRFLEGMIDHHQMALDMAHDCLMKASTEPVVQLCQNVITAQSREIQVMRGYLLIWYGVEYQPMSMMMMQCGMMQGGMMGGSMMQSGGMMQGSQYDQHHPDQGAQGMQVATPPPAAGGMMDDGMMQGGMNSGGTMPGGTNSGDMMQGSTMPGCMMPGDPAGMMGMMSGFGGLTGIEYEIAWLEAMIDHHDDALHMSGRILKVTERPELQALAQGIIDAQTAEIAQMEDMITELSATSS